MDGLDEVIKDVVAVKEVAARGQCTYEEVVRAQELILLQDSVKVLCHIRDELGRLRREVSQAAVNRR